MYIYLFDVHSFVYVCMYTLFIYLLFIDVFAFYLI